MLYLLFTEDLETFMTALEQWKHQHIMALGMTARNTKGTIARTLVVEHRSSDDLVEQF